MGQADAASITKSFTGTIAGSFTTDTFGWFAASGSSLDGLTVSGSYSYDPGLMDFAVNNSAVDTYFAEGTNVGAISMSVTINGITHAAQSSVFGQVETSDHDEGAPAGTYDLFVHGASDTLDLYFTLFGQGTWVAGQNPALIDAPIIFAALTQQFSIAAGNDQFSETLSFDVTADAEQDVPEPASATLMLLGLASLAGAKRQRR
jgi:hypothetical protein